MVGLLLSFYCFVYSYNNLAGIIIIIIIIINLSIINHLSLMIIINQSTDQSLSSSSSSSSSSLSLSSSLGKGKIVSCFYSICGSVMFFLSSSFHTFGCHSDMGIELNIIIHQKLITIIIS